MKRKLAMSFVLIAVIWLLAAIGTSDDSIPPDDSVEPEFFSITIDATPTLAETFGNLSLNSGQPQGAAPHIDFDSPEWFPGGVWQNSIDELWTIDNAGATLNDMTNEPIPEPSTIALFGFGILSIAVRGWRRRKKAV